MLDCTSVIDSTLIEHQCPVTVPATGVNATIAASSNSAATAAASSSGIVNSARSPTASSQQASSTPGGGANSSSHSHHPPPPHQPVGLRMAVTSAVVRPAGASPTAVASVSPASQSGGSASGGGPAGLPSNSAAGSASGRCCETGRTLYADPVTGQTICSCQYDLFAGSYQRLGAIPTAALSMYSAPYAAAAAAASAEGMAAYFPGLAAEQAPFYSTQAGGLDLKENLGAAGAAATWPYPSVYHPYDATFAGYPFNGYGMDLNGARRKNATRETTSTLKAWLNEHKKNPYPTKGEKIMLAIITKMTLTQVSTWFANARRRLKKENKMTWEPRNRVEDEDNNNDDDDSGRKSVDDKDRLDSKDSGTGSSEDGERGPSASHRLDLIHGSSGPGGLGSGRHDFDSWNESRPASSPGSPECLYDRDRPPHHPIQFANHPGLLASAGQQQRAGHHPHHPHHHPLLRHHSPERTSPGGRPLPPSTSHSGGGGGIVATPGSNSSSRPRIWSLADMASKDGDAQSASAMAAAAVLSSPYANSNNVGKIFSPLASRLPPHHPLHPAQMHAAAAAAAAASAGGGPAGHYAIKPPGAEFYRNFYGAAPHEMAILEQYQRTLALGGVMPPTSCAPNMLQTASSSSTAAANLKIPFSINNGGNSTTSGGGATPTSSSSQPVMLTTVQSGISPSSSSQASSNGSTTEQPSPNPSSGASLAPTELKSPGRV